MYKFDYTGFYDIFYVDEKHRVWIDNEVEFNTLTNDKKIIDVRMVRCSGCIFDSLAQRDHIECPDGCLHSLIECKGCNMSTS